MWQALTRKGRVIGEIGHKPEHKDSAREGGEGGFQKASPGALAHPISPIPLVFLALPMRSVGSSMTD